MTMAIQVIVMGGVLSLLFFFVDSSPGVEMFQAFWLIYIEVLLVMALALFFSSFSSPFLSGMLTLGVFIIGRFVDSILLNKLAADDSGPLMHLMAKMAKALAHVAPDLSIFNTTPYVVYDQAIAWSYVYQATTYGVTYLAILLFLASLIFSRRDFV
jgi:hypothetical protein